MSVDEYTAICKERWAEIRKELATKSKFVKDRNGAMIEVIDKKEVYAALDKYLMGVNK